jgi:multicomponent Na+:H+ antiporter subunit E
MFLLNILLMLVWAMLTGQYTSWSLVTGFVLSYLLLWLISPAIGETGYIRRSRHLFGLLVFFLRELVISNLRVAYDVLTPRHHMRPGIIRVPLDLASDGQITLLASLITLTPGTLTLDISVDRKTLFMHDMYIHEREQAVTRITDGFERRIRELGQP